MEYQFRALDADGDWQWGAGKGSYFYDNKAIMADIETALKIFLGEVFWDLSAGVDWLNLIGGKNPQARQGIILQCRTVINNVDGVVRINKVDSSLNVATRGLSVDYNVDTVFSRGLSATADLTA